MTSRSLAGVVLIVVLSLSGCGDSAKAKRADISQDLDQLKSGMSMDEVTALFGKPKKRTDGPQVAEPDPPGYQSGQVTQVLTAEGIWSSRNPVEREVVNIMSGGWPVHRQQPKDFQVQTPVDPAAKVSWLYKKEKPQTVLLVLAFYDGKLGSADLFTVNSPQQGK